MSIENVLPAVIASIAAHSPFAALVGTDVGKMADNTPWLFQDTAEDNRPFRDPKGTGKATVVVGFRDSWGVNRHNTMAMPVIQVLVYADLSRHVDGTPQGRDAKDRALRVWSALDSLLHDTGGALSGHKVTLANPVASVTFVSSARTEGPSVMPVPDGDGMERLMARYEVAVV